MREYCSSISRFTAPKDILQRRRPETREKCQSYVLLHTPLYLHNTSDSSKVPEHCILITGVYKSCMPSSLKCSVASCCHMVLIDQCYHKWRVLFHKVWNQEYQLHQFCHELSHLVLKALFHSYGSAMFFKEEMASLYYSFFWALCFSLSLKAFQNITEPALPYVAQYSSCSSNSTVRGCNGYWVSINSIIVVSPCPVLIAEYISRWLLWNNEAASTAMYLYIASYVHIAV